MSELSRRAGVPVPTIKYYLREGLLPSGVATAATQAQYDERHLQRLLLIRALADVGELRLASIHRIVDAVDDQGASVHELLGVALYALGTPSDSAAVPEDEEWATVRADVDRFLNRGDWHVAPAAPARNQLVHALLALRRLGYQRTVDDLQPHADAARTLASHEVDRISTATARDDAVRRAVALTVLYEPILLAFRRLAHEDRSARRFGS